MKNLNNHFTNFPLFKLNGKATIKHKSLIRKEYIVNGDSKNTKFTRLTRFIEILLKAKSLPMGSHFNNKFGLIIIIMTIFCYIITRDFSFELFNYNKYLAYLLSFLIYINLIYLAVNTELRIFNLIFKAGPAIVSHYWNNKNTKSPEAKGSSGQGSVGLEKYYYIMLTYIGLILIYNLISILIMYRFLYILQLHELLFKSVNFNIFLILCISTIIVFIYTKNNNPQFQIRNNKLNNFMCFSLFSLFFSLFLILIFPFLHSFLSIFSLSFLLQTTPCYLDGDGDIGMPNQSDSNPTISFFAPQATQEGDNSPLNPSLDSGPIASSSSLIEDSSNSIEPEDYDSDSSINSSIGIEDSNSLFQLSQEEYSSSSDQEDSDSDNSVISTVSSTHAEIGSNSSRSSSVNSEEEESNEYEEYDEYGEHEVQEEEEEEEEESNKPEESDKSDEHEVQEES
jgi:hypothetical protein